MQNRLLRRLSLKNGNVSVFLLLSMLGLGLFALQQTIVIARSQNADLSYMRERTNFLMLRENFLVYLRNSSTITNTRSNAVNSNAFLCIGTNCDQDDVFDLVLFDPDNVLVPTDGFRKDGSSCTGEFGLADCLYKFKLTWKVDCTPNPSPCANPVVKYYGILEQFQNATEQLINADAYKITPEDL